MPHKPPADTARLADQLRRRLADSHADSGASGNRDWQKILRSASDWRSVQQSRRISTLAGHPTNNVRVAGSVPGFGIRIFARAPVLVDTLEASVQRNARGRSATLLALSVDERKYTSPPLSHLPFP